MPKKKIEVVKEEVVQPIVKEEVVQPIVKEEVVIENPAVVTGKFYALRRGDKFVVVNRSGQIVSKPLIEAKAIEMVQRFEGLTR